MNLYHHCMGRIYRIALNFREFKFFKIILKNYDSIVGLGLVLESEWKTCGS